MRSPESEVCSGPGRGPSVAAAGGENVIGAGGGGGDGWTGGGGAGGAMGLTDSPCGSRAVVVAATGVGIGDRFDDGTCVRAAAAGEL